MIFTYLLCVHIVNTQCCSFDPVSIALGPLVMSAVTFIFAFCHFVCTFFSLNNSS